MDFWRKPATKDESGWRGPARVVETGEGGGATVQWQGRMLQVRTQDLRRALVYAALLAFPVSEVQDPRDILVAFAEGLQRGQIVRVGWVRVDSPSPSPRTPLVVIHHPPGGCGQGTPRSTAKYCWRLSTSPLLTSASQAASAPALAMERPHSRD